MILEIGMMLGIMIAQSHCLYGTDMSDTDYQVTVDQHGRAGEKIVNDYGRTAMEGCINGGAAGAATTRTPQGAATGCFAGACGNVAQKALFPNDSIYYLFLN